MNINDMQYSNIKKKLNPETINVLFGAMNAYAATNIDDINEEKATLTLFLSIFKNNNIMRKKFYPMIQNINIEGLEQKTLNDEEYNKIYDGVFKDILYKMYILAYQNYDCKSLEKLNLDYILTLLFKGGVIENGLLIKLLSNSKYSYNEWALVVDVYFSNSTKQKGHLHDLDITNYNNNPAKLNTSRAEPIAIIKKNKI